MSSSPAGAGALLVGAILACAAVGLGIGALLGAPALLALAGGFVGVGVGFWLVYSASKTSDDAATARRPLPPLKVPAWIRYLDLVVLVAGAAALPARGSAAGGLPRRRRGLDRAAHHPAAAAAPRGGLRRSAGRRPGYRRQHDRARLARAPARSSRVGLAAGDEAGLAAALLVIAPLHRLLHGQHDHAADRAGRQVDDDRDRRHSLRGRRHEHAAQGPDRSSGSTRCSRSCST